MNNEYHLAQSHWNYSKFHLLPELTEIDHLMVYQSSRRGGPNAQFTLQPVGQRLVVSEGAFDLSSLLIQRHDVTTDVLPVRQLSLPTQQEAQRLIDVTFDPIQSGQAQQ